MGYRSEVMAVVYSNDAQEPEVHYNRLKLLMNTTYKELLDYWHDSFEWKENNKALRFTAMDVKWYPSYPEVARLEQFLGEIEELDYEVEFVRIGEDYNDVETRYSEGCSYHLSVRREIVSDV